MQPVVHGGGGRRKGVGGLFLAVLTFARRGPKLRSNFGPPT
jgi:hypothetical protein